VWTEAASTCMCANGRGMAGAIENEKFYEGEKK
jgi:hypothetical protein